LYAIQQQQQQQINFKLIQTFPQEHSSLTISSLLQINPNTLVSASSNYSDSSNVIVIWSKSKSSPFYESLQRITQKETGGDISRLVLINQKKEGEEEEEFASSSLNDHSIIIWRRKGKGDKEFQIKQKIENEYCVETLLYIPLTNELISGSYSYPSPLQIWSPSPSSSSNFVERQKIEIPYSRGIWSLCQINETRNDSRIEFASGHYNGQIMIWSKPRQINESNHYSLLKTLKPFDDNERVSDLIFLNDKGFDLLISCCHDENKIKIFKGEEQEEEEEELEHKEVRRLIPMSNGQFASGGDNKCLNIWSPSSSSS
jgi:hypothetical protein